MRFMLYSCRDVIYAVQSRDPNTPVLQSPRYSQQVAQWRVAWRISANSLYVIHHQPKDAMPHNNLALL